MENQTRFDLNAAIKNWRQELAAQPNLATDDRRELETHLRDAIAGFQQRGLNNEESFWLARRRVGHPQPLGQEFEKADPAKIWRERVFWMVLAYLAIVLWGTSASVFFNAFANNWAGKLAGAWASNSMGTQLFYDNCFHLVFYLLPILICALLLAKGRLGFNDPRLLTFFCSRSRLAVTAVLWILINSSMTAWHLWPVLIGGFSRTHINSHAFAIAWANLWSSFFYTTIWPFLLIALLVWLMPPQNQKTPKRA